MLELLDRRWIADDADEAVQERARRRVCEHLVGCSFIFVHAEQKLTHVLDVDPEVAQMLLPRTLAVLGVDVSRGNLAAQRGEFRLELAVVEESTAGSTQREVSQRQLRDNTSRRPEELARWGRGRGAARLPEAGSDQHPRRAGSHPVTVGHRALDLDDEVGRISARNVVLEAFKFALLVLPALCAAGQELVGLGNEDVIDRTEQRGLAAAVLQADDEVIRIAAR